MADVDLNELIGDATPRKTPQKHAVVHEAHKKMHAPAAHAAHATHTDAKRPASPSSSKIMAWTLGIVSVVLLVALVASILTHGFGTAGSGVVLSQEDTKAKTLAYVESLVPGQAISIDAITDEGSLYAIQLSVAGKQYNSYVSKDGKYLFPSGGIDMSQPVPTTDAQAQAATPVPKNDKPAVELFVMSYCPYGTQIEKGILPVANVLGNKIDFKVRFVYYSMHPGAGEVQENLRQYCIQKDQPSVYGKYLACFLNASDSAGCIKSTGVDQSRLDSCYAAADAQFNETGMLNDKSTWLKYQGEPAFVPFNTDLELNQKYGVKGSPTLVINGVEVGTNRDSASLLKAICAGFTNPPAECSTKLSATTPGPGFGYDSTSAATAAGCGV